MSASIDKLDFILPEHIGISDIKERLRKVGLTASIGRTAYSRNYILNVGPIDYGVGFLLPRSDSKSVNIGKTNPTKTGSMKRYWSILRQCVSRNHLEHSEIIRLDLANDINDNFNNILSGIVIKYKQSRRRYLEKGGRRTGVYFGNKPEEICVYDRSGPLKNESVESTRIEVRLTGKKKPINYIHQIPNLLGFDKNGEPFKPFKNIGILNVDFTPYSNFEAKKDIYLSGYVKGTFDEAGYLITKKRLNTNGNFNRDIKNKFLSLEKYPIDLDMKFTAGLHTFCRDWDEKYLTWSSEALFEFIKRSNSQPPSEMKHINPSQLRPL